MKAKLKGTNEIVEVKPKGTVKTINVTCSEFESEDGRVFPSLGLDIINDVDWEQRRYEIAKAVIGSAGQDPQWSAEYAILCADALIEKLKKKGE